MAGDPDGLRPANDENDLFMGPIVALPVTVPDEEETEDQNEGDQEESSSGSEKIEFDPKYREPFIGLLHLGNLTKEVTLYGHTFKLVTPTQRERLEAGVIHKRFANSISAEIGWATLVTALYLQEVDYISLPEPIGPSTQTAVLDRFNWVQDNIRPDLVQQIFEQTLELDALVASTLEELETSAKR